MRLFFYGEWKYVLQLYAGAVCNQYNILVAVEGLSETLHRW